MMGARVFVGLFFLVMFGLTLFGILYVDAQVSGSLTDEDLAVIEPLRAVGVDRDMLSEAIDYHGGSAAYYRQGSDGRARWFIVDEDGLILAWIDYE